MVADRYKQHAIILLLILSLNPQGCKSLAADQSDIDQIEKLTNQVVKKELELLRLNAYFRIESTYRTDFRSKRDFLYNLSGAGVSLGGSTTLAAENWSNWQRPENTSRNTLKAASIMLMTGHSIIVGGTLIEAAVDYIKSRLRKKQGWDPETTKRRVLELQADIDRLIRLRRAAVRNAKDISDERGKVVRFEGRVLRDLKNLALVQYASFYSRAHKRSASRNLSYVNALLAGTTGGYMGSLNNLIATANHRPSLLTVSGTGFIISGSTVMLSPFVNHFGSKFFAKRAMKKVKQELGEIEGVTVELLALDLEALEAGIGPLADLESAERVRRRISIYKEASEMFFNQANFDASEAKESESTFKYRALANSALGGTKMTWGIMLAYAGSRYYNAPERFKKTVAQAATVYINSHSMWVLDTLYNRNRGRAYKFPIGAQLHLPKVELEDRVDRLMELEGMLDTI